MVRGEIYSRQRASRETCKKFSQELKSVYNICPNQQSTQYSDVWFMNSLFFLTGGRIHLSSDTYKIIKQTGMFTAVLRGVVTVKVIFQPTTCKIELQK